MSEILTLFPQAILNDYNLIDVDISNLETEENFGNISTVSKNVLYQYPDVEEYIISKISEYKKNIMCADRNIEFYITHSWINITSQGQFHHMHDHPNSIISGIYYIKADPFYDSITFKMPAANKPCLNLNVEEYNLFNSQEWTIPVTSGQILLFPSNLQHEVKVSQNPEDRISLAFNIFVKGKIGLPGNTDNFII